MLAEQAWHRGITAPIWDAFGNKYRESSRGTFSQKFSPPLGLIRKSRPPVGYSGLALPWDDYPPVGINSKKPPSSGKNPINIIHRIFWGSKFHINYKVIYIITRRASIYTDAGYTAQ